ncbi:hypothetical protein D3Z55_01450 [Clostridiaceae bacterium]|nr:hypothetical protein [Clostridiaceae bacterium]
MYREGSFLESYLFYHPNMPKDVKTYYNGKSDERHELTLIELEPGWYFFSRCSEKQWNMIVW